MTGGGEDAGAGTVELRTASAAETRALGVALARVARAGDRIALLGPLGAGKTQLAKGFGAGLGIVEPITSPSFTLMAEHLGRLPLFHLDLYRLDDGAAAVADGMLDEREDSGVTLIEWADRLDASLDPERLVIRLVATTDDERRVTLSAPAGAGLERFLEAARTWAAGDRSVDG